MSVVLYTRSSILWKRPLTNRYFTEGAFDPIAVVAGLIQTAIYADFGYIVSSFFSEVVNTLTTVRHKVCFGNPI